MRKKELFQIYRALASIIFVLAALGFYAKPSSGEYTENFARDLVYSQIEKEDTYSGESAKANRHILFNGGGSIWDAAEYSQYEYFLIWYKWSVAQPNSETVSIFSDGFRNEENSLELYEVTEENISKIGIPNLVLWEDSEIVFRRASFPNSFSATYTNLEERFKEANHQTHDLLMVIEGHGISPVNKKDNSCQIVLQGELEDDGYNANIKSFGFTDLGARDSLIVGWYGEEDRDAAFKRDKIDGRANQLITSKDLFRMRDELSISGDFKFVANQCYSGAVAWMAFDPSRQRLRGDTCGITASTFYYHSSGCSVYSNLKEGHGYWVSRGIAEQIDIDGDGETSLLDLHLYALMNDEYDRGPQITSGVLLQQKGLLPWPIDSEKDFVVNQDSFPNIFRGWAEQEHACVSLSHVFEETQSRVQDRLEEVSLIERNERKLSQLLEAGLSQNEAYFLDETMERYRLYLKAEQTFLEVATTEEIEAYLSVKRCEMSAIR